MAGGGDLDLTVRTVLVTGASGTIGAALGFARAGAGVVLASRGAGRLEAVAERVRAETGRRVGAVAIDVADPAAPARLLAAGNDAGGVDVLVNNAYAGGGQLPVLTTDDEAAEQAWERAVAVNLLAPARPARAFGRRMVAAGGGCILNVISGSALQVSPGLAVYGATKAALWTLTRLPGRRGRALGARERPVPGTGERGRPATQRRTARVARPRPDGPGRTAGGDGRRGAVPVLPRGELQHGGLLVANGGRPS